ncbi:MAG: 50S ribosomal protein L33 [Bacilli bacterium]
MREKVVLVCSECESRNYNATKKKGDGTRMEVNKFCPKCGKYTLHKEGK